MVNVSSVFSWQEFMRGGEPLDDLISELLEHGDKEALLELVVTCIHRY